MRTALQNPSPPAWKTMFCRTTSSTSRKACSDYGRIMNVHQIVLILRARFGLILLTWLATVTVAVAVALILPPRYTASTSLVLEMKGIDQITGTVLPAQVLMPNFMATEIDIIQSHAVALKVVKTLNLAASAATKVQFEKAGAKGAIKAWLP